MHHLYSFSLLLSPWHQYLVVPIVSCLPSACYFTKRGSAAAAKSLQSRPTLCDPTDGSPPGSPVPGFSRQEHWSGLPLASPVHESEKWKWSHSVVSDSSKPHGLQPTRLLCPWDFPGKSTGVDYHCLLQREALEISFPRKLGSWWLYELIIYWLGICLDSISTRYKESRQWG